MRFSTSGFFHESVSPRPPSIPLGPFLIFSKIRGENDTGEKFIAVIFFSGKHSFANISANFRKNLKWF